MTLKEVATRAGISESFLSQVERGLVGASVPTLWSVATVLGVMVADLFEPDQVLGPRVVRHERRSMMNFGGARNYLLTARPLNNLEVFWIELDPDQSTAESPFTHGDSDPGRGDRRGRCDDRRHLVPPANRRQHRLQQRRPAYVPQQRYDPGRGNHRGQPAKHVTWDCRRDTTGSRNIRERTWRRSRGLGG
jgi:transcriptional regulator with XRE-family HTH domain